MGTCLWTDHGQTEEWLDRRIFPRAFAMAEQMWSTAERLPYEKFRSRVYTREAWLASFASWVMKRSDIPLARLTRWINAKISFWTVTSRAVVGSSAISRAGSHAMAAASRTRCLIPPLN